MSTSLRYPTTIVVCLALLLSAHPPLGAQAKPETPLVVAIPDAFPEIDGSAVLLRTPEQDVVLLRRGSDTVESLAVALDLIERLRRDTPLPTKGQIIPITGFALTRPLQSDRTTRVQALLRALQRERRRQVGNLGLGRWLQYR